MATPQGRTKPSTEAQIIDAAERLFGRFGINGVSLRQIAAAAGSANHSVVRYYFATKENLVQAILAARLPQLEALRATRLAQARRAGGGEDARAMLEALLRPLADLRDADGRRSYAAFLLGHRAFPTARRAAAAIAPLTDHIVDLIASATPEAPRALFLRRLMSVADAYCTTLVELDAAPSANWPRPVEESLVLHDVLDAGAAFIAAPVAAEVAEAFAKVP